MVFVYILLLIALLFSCQKKFQKTGWVLTLFAFFLTLGIFVYHSLSPLAVHL